MNSSEAKKRKINPPPRRVPPFTTTKDSFPKANDSATVASVNANIQHAKNFAIAQAQREGCTANFRIFDSPFGNFLIPAIPTRADLSG